jgi:hypothetical protein
MDGLDIRIILSDNGGGAYRTGAARADVGSVAIQWKKLGGKSDHNGAIGALRSRSAVDILLRIVGIGELARASVPTLTTV